ncbi:unnamed protein product [Coffea canephora]|uniref:DH200=94 genomic scaffold, scaffold_5400 n=1 Tax=Coffea canephora TaxID=49390 RepID=A0A068VLI5_COFCA|nr:unnamed protein product [Coffea canephora]
MASNNKALISVLFFLFLLSTQSIVPATARKILGTSEFGSNDNVQATRKLEGQIDPPWNPVGPYPSDGPRFETVKPIP